MKRTSRRISIFAMAMALVMAFSSISTFGDLEMQEQEVQFEDNAVTSFIEANGFTFEILEYTDEYHRTVRRLERDFIPLSRVDNFTQGRNILLALGIQEESIDLMYREDVEVFATSPQITITTANAISDVYGNSRYVSEAYAIEYSEYIQAGRIAEIQSNLNGVLARNVVGTAFDNGVLRIDHVVAQRPGGSGRQFMATTVLNWRTLPNSTFNLPIRGSIGSAAQNTSIHPGTPRGNYIFTNETFINGVSQGAFTAHRNFTQFRVDSLSFSAGAGAVFYVPNARITVDNVTSTARDLHASFTYELEFNGMNSFNSVATVSHSSTSIGINSLTLRFGATSSVSLSFGIREINSTVFTTPSILVFLQ